MTLDTLLLRKRLKTKNISSSYRKTHSRQTFEQKALNSVFKPGIENLNNLTTVLCNLAV